MLIVLLSAFLAFAIGLCEMWKLSNIISAWKLSLSSCDLKEFNCKTMQTKRIIKQAAFLRSQTEVKRKKKD